MDFLAYGRFALALAVVIGLIVGFAWLVRKYGQGRLMPGGARRRLGIVEVTTLDARRRLVLVRRDDVEHLLILGPSGETVVERSIPSPADAAAAPQTPIPSLRLARTATMEKST